MGWPRSSSSIQSMRLPFGLACSGTSPSTCARAQTPMYVDPFQSRPLLTPENTVHFLHPETPSFQLQAPPSIPSHLPNIFPPQSCPIGPRPGPTHLLSPSTFLSTSSCPPDHPNRFLPKTPTFGAGLLWGSRPPLCCWMLNFLCPCGISLGARGSWDLVPQRGPHLPPLNPERWAGGGRRCQRSLSHLEPHVPTGSQSLFSIPSTLTGNTPSWGVA